MARKIKQEHLKELSDAVLDMDEERTVAAATMNSTSCRSL
jgi:hypothetical protein